MWMSLNMRFFCGLCLLSEISVTGSMFENSDDRNDESRRLRNSGGLTALLFFHQSRTGRFKRLMLILVQRGRQFKIEFLVLRIDGLRRQQRHLAIFQQLENPLDLERGRPTGEFAFLAALFDRDPVDGILANKRRHLSGKDFDVGGFVVIVEADFPGVQFDVAQGLAVEGSHGDDCFTAFDFDAADFHFNSFS